MRSNHSARAHVLRVTLRISFSVGTTSSTISSSRSESQLNKAVLQIRGDFASLGRLYREWIPTRNSPSAHLRIVYPQARIILARNVSKPAEALVRVDLVCLVTVLWIGCWA